MFEDQKKQMTPKMARQASTGKHPIGLPFLGKNFIQAFEFYQLMGDNYFKLAKTEKSALVAAR